ELRRAALPARGDQGNGSARQALLDEPLRLPRPGAGDPRPQGPGREHGLDDHLPRRAQAVPARVPRHAPPGAARRRKAALRRLLHVRDGLPGAVHLHRGGRVRGPGHREVPGPLRDRRAALHRLRLLRRGLPEGRHPDGHRNARAGGALTAAGGVREGGAPAGAGRRAPERRAHLPRPAAHAVAARAGGAGRHQQGRPKPSLRLVGFDQSRGGVAVIRPRRGDIMRIPFVWAIPVACVVACVSGCTQPSGAVPSESSINTLSLENRLAAESPDDSDEVGVRARAAQGLRFSPVAVRTSALTRRQMLRVGLGSYIVNGTADCNGCHGSAAGFLAGGNPFSLGGAGVVYARNLTGLTLTEDQFMETMRTGKDHRDQSGMLVVMPWLIFRWMSDEDLKAVYAYLRAVPPLQNAVRP